MRNLLIFFTNIRSDIMYNHEDKRRRKNVR